MATITAKTETGATWAARMDNTTLRNWTASQLYDFTSILPNSYFNYGRYMNGLDFTKISNSSKVSKADDGHQSSMFKQFHEVGTLYVTDYTYDLWAGLDPAAVTKTSAYWLANNNQGFEDFATWTKSTSAGDPYPTVTAKLTSDMKHLRAGMFSMLTASQIGQIAQPWAIPLSYWTGQYFTGTFAPTKLSYLKKTRVDFNFNLLYKKKSVGYFGQEEETYKGGIAPSRFYMDDIFNYANSGSAGQKVTSLPSSDGLDPLIGNTTTDAYPVTVGTDTYYFGLHAAGLSTASTGFADTFRVNVRTQDRVAITGIAAANWAYLGSWLDSSGNYLNIGERKLASGGISSSPWAYNFFQYFASTDGNIDDDSDTVVIRLLSAQQISYIGTKSGTTSWVSANSVYVKASGWAEVGVTFLGNLTGAQLALVSNLETFSNDELAALAPWQVSSGFSGQNWSSLSGAQLNQLSISASDATKNTFAYLPIAAYQGFSTSALQLLDAAHVAQIPLRAFDVMGISQLNALGTRLGAVASAAMVTHLTNSKLSQLGSSFFNGLPNGDFLNALTITQLGQIPTTSFAQLSNAAVAGLNATTLARLSDAQLSAISNQQYLTNPNGLLLRTTTTGIDMAKLVANPLVDWTRITYYFLNQLSQANFNLLTPAIWKRIPSSVLGRLTLLQTQRLSETVLTALSDSQFGALKFVGQISASLVKKVFTGSRVSGLRPYSFWSYVTPAMFNALSTKAETINGVTYSNVVARIPVAAISQLPVAVFAGIDTAHLEAFSNSQLANLTPNQFAAIDASKFLPYTDADGVVHPSRILTQVSLNTFKALQPTQIRRLYEFLFNTVDDNAFDNVTADQAETNKRAFADLLGRIMDGDDGREQWLGNAVNMLLALNWLDADVVANIDLVQIQDVGYMNINWGWMSATFLNSISPEVFGALKASNLMQVNLTAMAGLDAAHIAALTATQVSAVYAPDGTQLAGLTAEQLSAISSIDSLSAAAVAAITPAVLGASSVNLAQRSSAFLNALTPQQYAALTGAQLAQFSNEQLTTLPIDWSLMGSQSLNGLSSVQFRLLTSNAKVVAFSAEAFAGLDAARWVDLALSADSLTTGQVKTLRQQLLDGLLPAEVEALIKGLGSDILQLQVLEIALVRQLASLNPAGENQYATALSAVLALRSQYSEKWTTGNVALLLSQLQYNIQRGNQLQVDSAPGAYYYADLFDRQINQLAMLPLQSPTATSAQIGALVGPYLAFIQGAFETKFLTPSYNGPDGFAQTQDRATYQEHLLQALLRFEDSLGRAPYTLFSLQEIDDIVAAAFDAAQHNITTTGASWDSLSDGERYLLVGQAMQSELLDKASTKVLTAAGQGSINSMLVDGAEMLANLGTVMYLVQLANDPGNSLGRSVAELGLSDANRTEYLGKAVFAALQQVASDTKQSVRALGVNLEQYLSGLGMASTRMASQFSSFKTELGLSLGQMSLLALLGSDSTAGLGNSSLTQDAETQFNSLQSRLGVNLKAVLMSNLGISAAQGQNLSTADLLAQLKARIAPLQNDTNAWNQQIIDISAAIASEQATAWPLANLGRVVWGMFQAVVTYKRPDAVGLAFGSTAMVDAVDDILMVMTPLLTETRNKNIDVTDTSSVWYKLINEGPLALHWELAVDEARHLPPQNGVDRRPMLAKYETVKFFIRSLYEKNGIHVSNDQVVEMLEQAFVKRTWDLVGQSDFVQHGSTDTGVNFEAILSAAINEATADVFGLGQESYILEKNGQVVQIGAVAGDSGWNNLQKVDPDLHTRLKHLVTENSEVRWSILTKVVAQKLKSTLALSQNPAVRDSPTLLRDFFYKLSTLTPVLDPQQGPNQLPFQPSLKELFFRSQGNVINPDSTLPGVDLPAPVKAVLLTALHDAASNGYFDGASRTPITNENFSTKGNFIIETPEALFARLMQLIDPQAFYNTAGVDFDAYLPGPNGTTVHRTIGDLRVIERPNGDPTYTAEQHARGQETAREVIRLTGSEEAAYEFLNKGRANETAVQLKYTKQFIQDAFQEVYKGALESFLKANPNPSTDVLDAMSKGLSRLTHYGGSEVFDNVTGLPKPNPVAGEDDVLNILLRGLESDGFGTPGTKAFTRMNPVLNPDHDYLHQYYRNGLATGFSKAVRSVIFGDQARKLDLLLNTYITDIAQDYTNTVAATRITGTTAAIDPTEFFTTRLQTALNQSVRDAVISEQFFTQCKKFGVITTDLSLDDVPVWEFRTKLYAASQGLTPDQAEAVYPRNALLKNSIQKAKVLIAAPPTQPANETHTPPVRSFHLAILGGNAAELTPLQRTQAQKVLQLLNARDGFIQTAALLVTGAENVNDPAVNDLIRFTKMEQERLALKGQRVRGGNIALPPEIEDVYAPIGSDSNNSTPGAANAISDYADPADVLRQVAADAASIQDDPVYAGVARRTTLATPSLLKRVAGDLFRVALRDQLTYTADELNTAAKAMLQRQGITLPNGEADVQTVVTEFLAKTEEITRLRLSSSESQSITERLGELPQIPSGSSTRGSISEEPEYAPVFGRSRLDELHGRQGISDPESPTGSNPANRIARGSAPQTATPDNVQLQSDVQLRSAVTRDQFSKSKPSPLPGNVKTTSVFSSRMNMVIEDLIRLSLSTWIDDSFSTRATHISEYLQKNGFPSSSDFVSQITQNIDLTLGEMFEILLTPNEEGITSDQQRILKLTGDEGIEHGWTLRPGVEWDLVFGKVYEPGTGGEETPVRTIFQRKINAIAARLISKGGASAPTQRSAVETLTREFAANLKYYGDVDVNWGDTATPPTGDRTRLGQLPVEAAQVDNLVRSSSEMVLRQGIFESPDAAAGFAIPKSRSLGDITALGAGGADDVATVRTLHAAVNKAVNAPETSPQTPEQVQAQVVNQVDAIYGVVDRKNQSLWLNSESQEFKLTASQMAEAYKNSEGFLTQGQGYEALREGIAMYLQEEFGTRQPLTQDLVDAYYKAISTELGDLLLGVDAQVLPASLEPFNTTQLGGALLDGMLSIGNAVVSGNPKALSRTLIQELSRLKVNAVPTTTAAGAADPVYDFVGQFIAKVQKLVVTNSMTVSEVLDQLITYATDLSTEQNGGANFRTLLNDLKSLQANTGYATPEGQLAIQKRILSGFKQLTTDLQSFNTSELGGATPEGMLSIGTAAANNRPQLLLNEIIGELSLILKSSVPPTTADGSAVPVYDFIFKFIYQADQLTTPPRMTVTDLLDQLIDIADNLGTQQQRDKVNITELLNKLKLLVNGPPDTTQEGKFQAQLKAMEAFKELTSEIRTKIPAKTLFPKQEQKAQQFVQLVEDLSQGLSTATQVQVVNDADQPTPLPSRATINAADYAEVQIAVRASGSQGELAVNAPDAPPSAAQTIGAAGGDNPSGVQLPNRQTEVVIRQGQAPDRVGGDEQLTIWVDDGRGNGVIEAEVRMPDRPDTPTGDANGVEADLPPSDGTGGPSLLAGDEDGPSLTPPRQVPTVRGTAHGELAEMLNSAPTPPTKKLELSRWARINNYLEASPTFKTTMNVTNAVMGVLGFLLSAAGMGMAIYGMISAIRNRDKMNTGQFATAMVMGAAGILNSAVGLIGIGIGAVAVIATKAAFAAAAAAAETAGKVLGVIGAGLGVLVSLAGLGLAVAGLSGTSGDERDVAIGNIAYAATQATIAVVGLIVTLAVCAAAGPVGWVVGIVVAIIALLLPNFGSIVQADKLVDKGTTVRNQQLWGQLWSLRCYYDVAYLSSLPTAQLGAAGYVDYLTGLYGPYMNKKWFDFEVMLEQEFAFLGDSSFVLRMDNVAKSINYKEIGNASAIGTVHQTLTHAYTLMVTQQTLEMFDKAEYTNTVRQAYITDYTPAPVRNPILHMATVDGNTLTLRFDRQMGGLDEMLPLKEQFSVKIAGSVVTITGLTINANGDVVLTLARAAIANESVTFSYTAPSGSNQTHALQDPAGYRSSNYTDHKVLNLKNSSQAAPQLIDAYFSASYVRLVFDQLLDADGSQISTSSFAVNAYLDTYLEATNNENEYLPVDIDAVHIKGNIVELELSKLSNGKISVLRSNYAKWASTGLPVAVRYSPPASHAIKSVSTNGGLSVAGFTVSNHQPGDSAAANVGTSVVLANQAASFGITRSGYVTGAGTDHSITIAGKSTGTLTYDHGFDWTDSWFTNSVTDDLAGIQQKMALYGNSDQVYALESEANASEKVRYLHKTNAVGELNYLSVSATKLAKDTFYLDARGSMGQNSISLDTQGTTALGGWGGNTFSYSRNLAASLHASVQNPGQESSNIVNISGNAYDSNTSIDLDRLVHSRYLLPRASFRVYGSSDGRDQITGTSDYQTYYSTGYTSNIELWGEGPQVSIGSATTTKLHGGNAQVLLDMAQWYMFGKTPTQAAAQNTGIVQGNYGSSSVLNLGATNFGEGLDGHVNFSNRVANLPDVSAFGVRVNNIAPGAGQQTDSFGSSVGVKSVRISGNSVILTLNQAVNSGQWVGLSYTRPGSSNDLVQDLAGNAVDNFNFSTSASQTIGNSTVSRLINRTGADLRPAVTQASVSGNTVTLRFSESLQSNAALLPKANAFIVKINGVAVAVTELSVVDNRLLLTLASASVSGDLVDVGYSDINDTLDDHVGVLQSINSGLDVASVAVRAYNVLTSTSAPVLQDSTVNGNLIALSFSDRLDTTRIPVNSDYVVSVNNQTVSIQSALVNNNGLLLTLVNPVVKGAVVKISYSPGNHDGTLRGLSSRAVASWSNTAVFNQTGVDSSPPLLQGGQLAGNTLTLAFSEDLDATAAHRPDKSVFSVSVDGTPVTIDSVTYSNNQINLGLENSVEGGRLVRVSYTPSDSQPRLRDLAGLELARFSGVSVRNMSRDVSAPTISSAVINGNYLIITFSEFLKLDMLPELENLHVRLGAQEVALVNSNLKDNVLTLSLGVSALPSSVVTFSYTHTPNSNNNFQDSSGNKVASVSNRAVVNITGKDIDAPALIDASVTGNQVILTLSENVITDAANIPGLSSFVVQVNGTAVSMASSNALAISRNTITLTLDSEVSADDQVKVSYSVPPVRTQGLFDQSGNAASSFSSNAVNNTKMTAPTLQSIAVDGYNLLINYDQDLDSTKGGLPAASAFSVEVRSSPTGVGTVVKVNTVVAYNKSLMLVLAEPITRDKTVLVSYTKPNIDTSDAALVAKTGFIRNLDGVNAASISNTAAINLTDTAQLQTVKVNGTDLSFVLSQPLSLRDADKPVLGSFVVTVDGKTVTPTAITLSAFGGTLRLPTAVTPGQVVTLAYTNNSTIKSNTETHRLRDFFGYEVGSFDATTATNITPSGASIRPNLVQSVVDGDQVILTYDRVLASAQSLMQMHFAVAGAVDASGKPLKTGKVNASGFLNFVGSNTNGDTYDLGDQSQVSQSQRLVYLQLGSGKDNVVTYRDTTGMVLSPSSTGNANIYVMPNAALTLYTTLEQNENLKPILKSKADEVLLYAGSSLQGVLNGYESIDARDPTSTVSAEVGAGKHEFKFGGQSYGMVFNRVNSTTTIKSPLTPYDTQQGQLLEFKESTTSEIYMGREADGTVVLNLHMLDSANNAYDSWVYYDGGTANLRLNAYDPNDGTRKYMFNIDKLVETLATVGLSTDSTAQTNKRTIADASSLSGQNMPLYRMTDIVKYNIAHSA